MLVADFSNSQNITVRASSDVQLPGLGQTIHFAIEWLFGQAVNVFEVTRLRNEVDLLVRVQAKVDPKSMAFAPNTTLGELNQHGYFPSVLPQGFSDPLTYTCEARDGQNRVGSTKDGTVIEAHHLRPRLTVAELSFGLADQILGLFCKGATICEYRGSMSRAQMYWNVGMTQKQIKNYYTNPYNYDPEWKVGRLLQG